MITRRDVLLATPAALAGQSVSQTAASQTAPQTPEDELNAIRAQQKRAGDQLAKFNVPPATEPACHFKA